MADPISILANADGHFRHSVLFIGGYGLRVHGYVRNTNDVDVLTSSADLESLEIELGKLGYVKTAQNEIFARFESENLLFAPIDVLLIDEAVFSNLAETAIEGKLLNTSVHAPSVLNFIALKLHAIKNDPSRKHKDLADIQELINRHRSKIDESDYHDIVAKYATPEIAAEIKEWLKT